MCLHARARDMYYIYVYLRIKYDLTRRILFSFSLSFVALRSVAFNERAVGPWEDCARARFDPRMWSITTTVDIGCAERRSGGGCGTVTTGHGGAGVVDRWPAQRNPEKLAIL